MLIFDAVSLYGLTYAAGALCFALLALWRIKSPKLYTLSAVCWCCSGAIIGARLSYVLCYAFEYYRAHPADILLLYRGGMSFHGAVLGFVLTALLLGGRQRFKLLDLAAVTALVFLPLGRICNFLNGELYGRITGFDFGMVFEAGGPELRYPSQLFEAAAEGPVTALMIFALYKMNLLKVPGNTACVFSACYAPLRFLIEFTREPDVQIGLLHGLSLGQWMCLVQLVLTALFWKFIVRRPGCSAKIQSGRRDQGTKSADV